MMHQSRRHLSALVVAVCMVVVAAAAALSVQSDVRSVPLDARSAAPDGALGLQLWLAQLGHPERTSVTAVPEFSRLQTGSRVMLLQAGVDLTGRSLADADRFIRRGGTLVVATDGTYNQHALKHFQIRSEPAAGSGLRVANRVLSRPPVRRLSGPTDVVISGSAGDVTAVETANGAVLLMRHVGRGTVWFLGAGSLLENRDVQNEDNWRLALNLAGPPSAPVILDGYVPHAEGGTTDWLTGTRWGVLVLFFIAVALLYRWLEGRRLGPPVIPLSDRHRASSEYVVSMASLLQRARTRSAMFSRYQQRIEQALDRGAPLLPEQRERVLPLLEPNAEPSESDLLRIARIDAELEEGLVRR